MMNFFSFFVALALALTSCLNVHAQAPSRTQAPHVTALAEADILPDVRLFDRTHPEKIIFSQLKLASQTPNLDQFAKASPFVQNAQEIDKSAMIFAEYNRIGNNFNLHDVTTPVIIHTRVAIDEYSSLQNMLVLDEFDETTFFQFGFYDHAVGLVPDQIKNFRQLSLSATSADRFFRKLSGQNHAMAEFVLIPFFADGNDPLDIDGTPYWLMAARIAEFRLWTSDNPEKAELLWFYRAPNYTPVDNEKINDLFLDPITQR